MHKMCQRFAYNLQIPTNEQPDINSIIIAYGTELLILKCHCQCIAKTKQPILLYFGHGHCQKKCQERVVLSLPTCGIKNLTWHRMINWYDMPMEEIILFIYVI